jgi:hypothetical protein
MWTLIGKLGEKTDDLTQRRRRRRRRRSRIEIERGGEKDGIAS